MVGWLSWQGWLAKLVGDGWWVAKLVGDGWWVAKLIGVGWLSW